MTYRTRCIALLAGALLGLLAVPAAAQTQAAAPPVPPAAPPAAPVGVAAVDPAIAAADYKFPSGAGMLIFHVATAKVADFDFVVGRIKEALLKAPQGDRARQAEHWAIYKSTEKPGESIPYLFVFDPTLPQASYDPVLLLAELLPDETQALYERLKAAVLKVERMGLTKIR